MTNALTTFLLAAASLSGASVTALAGAPIPGLTVAEPAQATRGVQRVVASGEFAGPVTRGSATVLETETGYELRLGADFHLDGATSPTVGFEADGKFANVSKLARLHGTQFYALPEGLTPTAFTDITIRDAGAAPLGTAILTFN